MSDEIEVLKIVCGRLNDASMPYMLTGSMAMNYYAQPRMTRDIDLVVSLRSIDAERFVALFAADFLCESDAVRDAIRDGGMFNVIHSTLIVKVDVVVQKQSPYRREEFARRRSVPIDGVVITIVAPEDLLLSKLDWARDTRSELQLGDVRNLILSVPDLDWGYVEKWANQLRLDDLLAKVRK